MLIAKYKERKMEPSTGIEKDYITEWNLIHRDKNDHDAKWGGNDWGIERVLTVGGEERGRDLLETGFTKEKAIKLTPWESNYEKAEKYGLAKQYYESRMKAKQVEKEKVESEQRKEEKAESEYFKTLQEYGHSRGLKETKILIDEYGGKGKKEGPGYIIGNGIGIVFWGIGRKYIHYSVTHLPTGKAMGPGSTDKKQMIALARIISKVTDWSKYDDEEDIPKKYMNRAAELVRQFVAKKIYPPKEYKEQTSRGATLDRALANKNTIDKDSPLVEKWLVNPGRYDVRGVDTPTRKSTRITPRMPRLK